MAAEAKQGGLSRRERRKLRLRKKIKGSDVVPRVSAFKSAKHTYAQLISDQSGRTLVSASTLDQEVLQAVAALNGEQLKGGTRSSKGVAAAFQVGLALGRRAVEKGYRKAVFDRNGFIYHGRIKAVAEGARQAGLVF